MSGTPLAVAFNRQTLDVVVRETLFGRVWLVRLGLSLLVSAALWLAWREPRRLGSMLKIGGTLLAGAYAATLAWTGHATGDTGADHSIHLTSDAVHLLAAGAWVGALPALISLLKRAGGGVARPEGFALAVSATRRFSTVGMVCVSALVVTGLVNAWYLVGSVPALLGTDYGWLLLCKLLLFALMVTLAAINRLRLTPQLATATPTSIGTPSRNALARLRRNTLLEMAAGVAIVGIVAALGLTTPAAHVLHHERPHSMTSEGRVH